MAKRNVRGDRETAAALRQLGTMLGTPAAAAARKALQPMLAEAKRNAPRRFGLLRRSLMIKKAGRGSRLRSTHLVGPRADAVGRGGAKAIRYAHLTEFGFRLRDGRTLPGRGWFRRAFEGTKDIVVERFNAELGPAIERQAQKLARKVR